MNIESRKSIRGDRQRITEKPAAREARKIYSDAGQTTRIRGEGSEIESDDDDECAAVHGSQENLYEKKSHEIEHSYARRFENKKGNNNENLKSSFRLRRDKPDLSYVRTKSQKQTKVKPNSQQIDEKVHGNKCLCVFFVTSICIALGYFLSDFIFVVGQSKHCSFGDLKNRYPNQNAILWKSLEFGINDILIEQINKPSVTLFVHKDSERAKELIRDIARTASNCMDSSMKPVEFRSSDFTSDDAVLDYGVIIDKYKKTAKEGNVVMIANLNEIPAQAARALHAICDRESPIFRKVVILLSLTAEYDGERRPIDIAEDALNNLWEGKIVENELGPLMTRVTDEVILLQSE